MKYWSFVMLDTQDGEKLKIGNPFEGEYLGETIDDHFGAIQNPNGEIHTVRKTNLYQTEQEAVNGILKAIKFFYRWHSDPKNAPAGNTDEWDRKAQATILYLKEKYGDENPEFFV